MKRGKALRKGLRAFYFWADEEYLMFQGAFGKIYLKNKLEFTEVKWSMMTHKKQRIRKIVVGLFITIFILIVGFQTIVHFNPYIKLVGTWYGDGTLDLLGDSPFDGALELTFHLDRTGYVVTEQSETTFTYDVHVHVRDIITLDAGNGFHHGQRFIIDGNTFNIIRDDGVVSFTRR
ncbi:hypothetical protein [Anaerotignum sp.]